jgi:hypothetical protein
MEYMNGWFVAASGYDENRPLIECRNSNLAANFGLAWKRPFAILLPAG